MSADITVTSSGELMIVAGVNAETDAGFEFVDAWLPKRDGAEYSVVDSGRLVIESEDVAQLVADAEAAGLEVDRVAGL